MEICGVVTLEVRMECQVYLILVRCKAELDCEVDIISHFSLMVCSLFCTAVYWGHHEAEWGVSIQFKVDCSAYVSVLM